MNHPKIDNRRSRGQALLLATIALGGVILGATAVAGVLTLYRLRAVTDIEHSAQAVFAADAGMGWSDYVHWVYQCPPPGPPCSGPPLPAFSDATVTVLCYGPGGSGGIGSAADCTATSTVSSTIAEGESWSSVRAFSETFPTSTTTTAP